VKRFDGRVAAITGAASGIGRALAIELARRGAHLALADIDDDGLADTVAQCEGAASGVKVTSQHLDVADRAAVEAWADQVVADHGRVNLIVNNAGVALDRGIAPSAVPLDLLRATYETNVFGVVRVMRAFLPLLGRSGNPVIVNVSSGMGSIGVTSDPERVESTIVSLAYTSSKTALNMLTSQWAKALPGMRVNAVDPGYTATDFNNHSGFRTAAEGAEPSVYLATLPDDGPSGILWGYLWTAGGYGRLDW
jgi:NAD(P)-dependent dehydrogenase (short-subunit alcohol dehydrogenase family)